MNNSAIGTFFASPARVTGEEIQRQRETVLAAGLISAMLDAMPEGAVVLNEHRQIVYANRSLREAFGIAGDGPLLGLRFGEAFKCVHANEGPGGCGTSEACQTCGAARAILASQETGRAEQECRITACAAGEETSLELNVWSTTITVGEYRFQIFALNDISHEKRRRVLERIFFHDILNTAGGIRGLAQLLQLEVPGDAPAEVADLAQSVTDASDALIQEILAQRQIMAAEHGELEVEHQALKARELIGGVIERIRQHQAASGKAIVVNMEENDLEFVSDSALLGRVLINLLKNALEAATPGQTVTIGAAQVDDRIEFRVHNPGVMPRTVQLQIFQRSFSTKGVGRGLGTYSVKLLTQKYLGGQVDFESTPGTGTTFKVRYPLYRDPSPPVD